MARYQRASSIIVKSRQSKQHLIGKAGTACEVCGWSFNRRDILRSVHCLITAHHVIPVACSGTSEPDNLVLLCPNCHAIAHDIWGKPRGGEWRGPKTRDELLSSLRLLVSDPDGWLEQERDRCASFFDGLF